MKLAVLFCLTLAAAARAEPAQAIQDAAASNAAAATTFEERILMAQDAENDEQYNNYLAAVRKRNGRHFARSMRACKARSPHSVDNGFTLVADITAQGKADSVAVKPESAVARCFASRFSTLSYPKPPHYPERDGFPLIMKIRVAG